VHDLRAKLRAATAEDHRRTEHSFADWLAAMPDSYGGFLRAHARAFPALGRALSAGLDWPPWQSRWQALRTDLAVFDRDPPPELNVTAAASRAEALGIAYVLEGSRLGSAVILQRVPPGLPTAYLSGGRDRAPWQRLLALLETVDPTDAGAAVAGACRAFRAFREAAAAEPAPRLLELQT
jgi:heme oxygenase